MAQKLKQKKKFEDVGVFSEYLIKDPACSSKVVNQIYQPNASKHDMYTWRITTDNSAPILHAHQKKLERSYLAPALRWIKYKENLNIEFPLDTIKPKVQKLLITPPGEIPRRVEVERQRRKYATVDLQQLLKKSDIPMWELLPIHILKQFDNDRSMEVLFPLDWFNDYEYDCMTPNDWLSLGLLNDTCHPIPAEAFLPCSNCSMETVNLYNIFTWSKVLVKDFDDETHRYLITELKTDISYKIPKINLMFIAENPFEFTNRIKYAIWRRRNAVKYMKFSLIVDCMMLTNVPELSDTLLTKICNLTYSDLKLRTSSSDKILNLISQAKLEYQKMLCKIQLESNIKKNPVEYSFIHIPEEDESIKFRTDKSDLKILDNLLKIGVAQLKKYIFYVVIESYIALTKVVSECMKVSKMSVFSFELSKTTTLNDFESVQLGTAGSVLQNLKGFWIENLSRQITMILRAVGKGWFDIAFTDWYHYSVSKLYKFMKLNKLRMQDAIRELILNSTKTYHDYLCNPCRILLHVEDDFIWGSDIINSKFISKFAHVFTLTLNINKTEPFYSTDPDLFETTLIHLYDEAIKGSHNISQIDHMVMHGLNFPPDLFLSSVGLLEEIIQKRRDFIKLCYQKALIPLNAYKNEFSSHVYFSNLDLDSYVSDVKANISASSEIKELVSYQNKMSDLIEKVMPSSIYIGPFLVIVEPLKRFLHEKRLELKFKLLEMFADRLTEQTENIISEYQAMMKKLTERPNSIEHIFELREWILEIPEIVQTLEDTMHKKLFEYEILEHFWHVLQNDQFKIKWNAIAWPLQVINQVAISLESFKEDADKFKKNQIFDLSTFDERVEGLNAQVVSYTYRYDLSKATEFSIDIKKMWKSILDLLEAGRTLNKRQILFEFPLIDLNGIEELMNGFSPYKILWMTAADFRKYVEVWCGNPFFNLDVESLQATVAEFIIALKDCKEHFRELPKIANVCQEMLQEIDEFDPQIKVMEYLRNPNWAVVHWQKLAKQSEMELKITSNINFQYLLKKGIMKHMHLVEALSEEATREKEAIQAAQAEELRLQLIQEAFLATRMNRRRKRNDLF